MGKKLRFYSGPESGFNKFDKSDKSDKSEVPGQIMSESQGTVNLDLFNFLRLILHNRRWLAGAVLTAGVLTATATLFIPNKYTATATLMPSGGNNKLSELAGITGLSMLDFAGNFSPSENSSILFPAILTSKRVMNLALRKTYSFSDGSDQLEMTMIDYLKEDNLDKARRDLEDLMTISHEYKTGLITLSVTTKYAELSSQIAYTFITELDRFNRTQRKTKATEYEGFLAGQLIKTEGTLALAENTMAEFQTVNRGWALSSDPGLQKEMLRLKRNLEIEDKKFLILTQQYEIAKSETQKDLPVVQALDEPTPPLIKSGPKRTVMTLIAMLAAGMLALTMLFIKEALRGGMTGPNRNSFASLKSDIRDTYPRFSKSFSKSFSRSFSRSFSKGVTARSGPLTPISNPISVGDTEPETATRDEG